MTETIFGYGYIDIYRGYRDILGIVQQWSPQSSWHTFGEHHITLGEFHGLR